MPAKVEKNLLTKEFKDFLKVYKRVATVKEVLEGRALRQEQQLSETQQMLQALDQRAQQIFQMAPQPVNELQEQEG